MAVCYENLARKRKITRCVEPGERRQEEKIGLCRTAAAVFSSRFLQSQ